MFGKLTKAVQIPQHQIAILHVAIYKMLHNITAYVSDATEGVKS